MKLLQNYTVRQKTARVIFATTLSNLKRNYYRLEHLNETSYKVCKCMDQQCSAIVKHIIKFFSCLPLSQTYVLSLNRH